jgi:hypothetical protein
VIAEPEDTDRPVAVLYPPAPPPPPCQLPPPPPPATTRYSTDDGAGIISGFNVIPKPIDIPNPISNAIFFS